MIRDTTPLIAAILEALLLLEHSADDEIDPDVAVRGMENIAACLHRLDAADQRALRAELADLAAAADDPTYRQFVAATADMLDLAAS